MWGTLINGIQAASLEHVDMTTASWNGATSALFRCTYTLDWAHLLLTVGFLVAYTAGRLLLHNYLHPRADNHLPAMFILYTTAPLLYRMASSAFYNISLLTSDFYGLIFGTLPFSFKCSQDG